MLSPSDFFEELRRRKVFRVAAGYAIGAVAVIAAASDILPVLGAADWILTTIVLTALCGFPVTLALAWVYEIHSGGVRRTPARGSEAAAASPVVADRRLPAVPVAVGIVVLVVAAATWGLVSRDRGAAAVDGALVAVLPFTARGGDGDDVWSAGMVDLLSRKIDASGVLRSADPNAVVGALGRVEDLETIDPAAVASRLGAGLYVLGTTTRVGGRLQLHATLYDHSGARRAEADAGPVPEDSVVEALDALAGRLLAPLLRDDAGELAGLAALTTRSMLALRAYLRGEQLLRRQQMDAARGAFQEAIAADSGFALAWYSLATAESWSEGSEIESIQRAFELAADLPPLERRLIEAHKFQLEGRHRAAEARYRAVLRLAPESLNAHYNLGEVIFHYGAFAGQSGVEAREHFENALAIRPDHGPSLNHLINIAAAEGNVAEVDSLTRIAEALTPEMADAYEAQRAVARRDSAALSSAIERLAQPWGAGVGLFNSAASLAGDVRSVRALYLARAAQPHAAPGARMWALQRAATLQIALGRPRAGYGELRRAVPPEGLPFLDQIAPQLDVLLPGIPWFPAGEEAVRRAGTTLISMMPQQWAASTRNVTGDPTSPDHPWYGNYLRHVAGLGTAHALAGNWEEALEHATQLDSLPDGESSHDGSLRRDLAAALRGLIHYRQGDHELALTRFQDMPMEVSYGVVQSGTDYADARYLRARLLAAAGRHGEALRWLDGLIGMSNPMSLLHRAPALLARAEIHDDLGDRDAAMRDYAAFLDLWRDPDPELRPIRDAAAARLAALSREG